MTKIETKRKQNKKKRNKKIGLIETKCWLFGCNMQKTMVGKKKVRKKKRNEKPNVREWMVLFRCWLTWCKPKEERKYKIKKNENRVSPIWMGPEMSLRRFMGKMAAKEEKRFFFVERLNIEWSGTGSCKWNENNIRTQKQKRSNRTKELNESSKRPKPASHSNTKSMANEGKGQRITGTRVYIDFGLRRRPPVTFQDNCQCISCIA